MGFRVEEVTNSGDACSDDVVLVNNVDLDGIFLVALAVVFVEECANGGRIVEVVVSNSKSLNAFGFFVVENL